MSDLDKNIIHTGDCFDVLTELPDESIHAVVSDPPYGLAFMGRDWDDFEPKEYQEWCERWARECLRVLKPGGHMLAFSGNRTHHRLFTGVEDAGFEIRDTLTWHYGSGFPKGSDVARGIDRRNGGGGGYKTDGDSFEGNRFVNQGRSQNVGVNGSEYETDDPVANEWKGWNTQLKPATEFVVMARKPYDGATVDSVLEHGTGALNIDGCRVGSEGGTRSVGKGKDSENCYGDGLNKTGSEDIGKGRYPANVVFDETAADALDAEVGELHNAGNKSESDIAEYDNTSYSAGVGRRNPNYHNDSGGPSRYFYTSKATKAERTLDGKIDNAHPTVKPGDLMQWLVKLVTAENQIVLDPFCGSGTTLRAAKDLGRQFIGIERQAKWADVARVRAGLTPEDPSNVRDDAGQSGLEAYKVTQ